MPRPRPLVCQVMRFAHNQVISELMRKNTKCQYLNDFYLNRVGVLASLNQAALGQVKRTKTANEKILPLAAGQPFCLHSVNAIIDPVNASSRK